MFSWRRARTSEARSTTLEAPDVLVREYGSTALLLATEPLAKVSGRVTYSQQILWEFCWIGEGQGLGFDRAGSGYSQI